MADEKFDAILQKIKDKQLLEDTECYYLAGKSEAAHLEKYKQMNDVFFEYVKAAYEKGEGSGNSVMYIGIGWNKAFQGDAMAANIPKVIEVLKIVMAKPDLYESNDTWKNGMNQFLMPVIYGNMDKLTKYHRDLAPILVGMMKIKSLGNSAAGYINQIHTANSRLFVPFIEQIIDNIEFNPISSYLLSTMQQAKPEIFHKKIDKIWQYFLDFEPNQKSSIVSCLWNISKEKPDIVAKYACTQDFKDGLFSQMTGSMVCYTVKEVAAVKPELFVDWIDDLVDAMRTMTAGYTLVPMALGNVARANEDTATKVSQIFIDTIMERKTDGTTVMMLLQGIKGIQDKYRNVIAKHIPAIKSLHDHPDTNVRNYVDMIVAVAEGRDLKSVNTKVEQTSSEVKEVKQEVKDTSQKVQTIDKKVNDQAVRVDKVETDVKETKAEVKATTAKVDKIEVKVDAQGKQIKEILDKFDELNLKVKDACKSYDDIKSYVDKNVETLKDFVASVAKELPTPVKFTSTGKIRRTLTLYFQCAHEYPECLYPKTSQFTTETSDWAKWLKVSMSLVKLGKALYEKEIFDVVDHVREIYEEIKGKEDADFMSYISEPFLTSAEQDKLIEQLRDKRFFEFFCYSSQTGQWVCNRCGKKENDKRSGKSETTSNTSSPGSTPNSPKAAKINSWLEVNIGMLGKFKSFWCIYEEEKISIFKGDKDTTKAKQVIVVKEIVKFSEVDPRVAKKENVFSLTTKAKTFKFAANSREVYATWRDVLKTE